MNLKVSHSCAEFNSYRSARVKSLFNAESGSSWSHEANIPLEDNNWKVGVIVGPSGSGKSSLAGQIWQGDALLDLYQGWPDDRPIIDAIAPTGDFNQVTGALAAVGLGDVPAWLRPFKVLSNGEKFRAGLARLLCDRPEKVIIDEFSSVVDRQVATIGAAAFAKSWRRGNGQVILLSCHYDILEYVQPDWIYDTREARLSRDCLRRPKIELDIYKVTGRGWKYFKPHYYLDLKPPVAAEYFIGVVNNEAVAHLVVAPMFTAKAYRATRLVVMPEWQGAGIGLAFLNTICQLHLEGKGRCGHQLGTFFHTSHPQLCGALRANKLWEQRSAKLYGSNRARCIASIAKSSSNTNIGKGSGYGGHFRAVQSFKYIGNEKT